MPDKARTGIERRLQELRDAVTAKIGPEEAISIIRWYGAYQEVGCPNCGFDFLLDGHPEMNIWPHFTGGCKNRILSVPPCGYCGHLDGHGINCDASSPVLTQPSARALSSAFCFECDDRARCDSAETCYGHHEGYPRRNAIEAEQCPKCGSPDKKKWVVSCAAGVPDPWHFTLEAERPVLPVPPEWRCFHCDEVFTDKKLAADHFGPDRDEGWEAACVDPMRADEKERRAELVSAHQEMMRQQDECQSLEEQLDNAKAELAQIPQYFGKGVTTIWLAGDRYKSALNLIEAARASSPVVAQHKQEREDSLAKISETAERVRSQPEIYGNNRMAAPAVAGRTQGDDEVILEREWMAQKEWLDYRNWLVHEVLRLRAALRESVREAPSDEIKVKCNCRPITRDGDMWHSKDCATRKRDAKTSSNQVFCPRCKSVRRDERNRVGSPFGTEWCYHPWHEFGSEPDKTATLHSASPEAPAAKEK